MRQYYISFSRRVDLVDVICQRFVRANNIFEAFVACGINCNDGNTTDRILLVYSERI